MIDSTFSQSMHKAVMEGYLTSINAQTENPFVLKGGTALYLCYGLDRFSVDIDLDAVDDIRGKTRNLFVSSITEFCEANDYEFHLGKSGEAGQKMYLHYDEGKSNPLKIEVSYRRAAIPSEEITVVSGIQVYKVDYLAEQKVSAFANRDRIRDLYDITYVVDKYHELLKPETLRQVQHALEYKGFEYFDYIASTQPDSFIDTSVLEMRFLETFEKVGLLTPKKLIKKRIAAAKEKSAEKSNTKATTGAKECQR